MTGYLRQNRGYFWMQHEIGVLDEKTPDTPEINRAKKIVQVNVENVAPFSMLYRVGDDRAIPLKTMRQLILPFLAGVDFLGTVLEKVREVMLQEP